jgi:hypothetical protein
MAAAKIPEHPAELLSPNALHELRGSGAPAVGAIAGRDSVAAIVQAVETHGFDVVQPTIVLTGTERGDLDDPLRAVAVAKDRLAGSATVLDPIWLSSPRLWKALNESCSARLSTRYYSWCACSACHLYVNLCRLPLSWMLGSVPIISGDRDAHDGRVKPSQTPEIIDALIAVFAHAGVTLLEPIRSATTERIEGLVGATWPEGGGQLTCDLGDTPQARQAKACYDSAEQRRLAEEYVIPAGTAVADAWRIETEPDYEQIVAEVLNRLPAE